MKFDCTNDRLQMAWTGEIKRHTVYEGNHYYLYVSAKDSGMDVYVCQAQMAQWIVAIPNLNASVIIDSLRDNVEYNAEKIGAAIENEIDGESIAQALYTFAEEMQIEEQDSSAAFMDSLKAAGYEVAKD